MKDPTAALDGHALAERYEALRHSVVELSGRGQTMMRGRALLMLKGMAAWMKCVHEVSMPSPPPAAPSNGLRLPVGIEQNLVDIVATMALATALEVIA